MIPFSPRGRENDRLKEHSFDTAPGLVARLESVVAEYHERRFAVAFDTPEAALTALLHAAVGTGKTLTAGAMGPLYHYTAAAAAGVSLRLSDVRLDGTLFEKSVAKRTGEAAGAVLEQSFCGIRRDLSALRDAVGERAEILYDATASLLPVRHEGAVLWSLREMMPEAAETTGFVLTDDRETADALRLLRWEGKKEGNLWNYDLVFKGADSALSPLGASIALRQFEGLGHACERRREIARELDGRLQRHKLFDLFSRSEADVPAGYPLLLTPQLYCPKEDIFRAVRDNGVGIAVCCKPVYKTAAWREDIRLDITEDFYKALLQLPCHHRLTEEEVSHTARSFLDAVEKYGYRGCSF